MDFDTPVAATIPNAKRLAEEFVRVEAKIAELNQELKALDSRRNHIRMVALPNILHELELTSIGVGNHTISLVTHVDASLSKDPERRQAALDWLSANGHGGIIKQNLIADLPKGDDATANMVIDVLGGLGISSTIEQNIHPQTYKAMAREIVRNGEVAPLDTLGIFIGNMAVVET